MSIAEKFEVIADEVYDKGKANESIAWIDAITHQGKRTEWSNVGVFGYTDFSDFEFAKPLVIKGNPSSLFRAYRGAKLPRQQDIDLREATTVYRTFSYLSEAYNAAKYIPDYGIPAVDKYDQAYDNSTAIETIEIIRCHENTTFTSNTFTNCTNLKTVTFEGTIGTNISFSTCKSLTVESLKNIITHLKDYSGTGDANDHTYTITLTTSAFNNLEAEGATAQYNGVACTWAELIDNKKWNLVKA